jgi:hypothetical protein
MPEQRYDCGYPSAPSLTWYPMKRANELAATPGQQAVGINPDSTWRSSHKPAVPTTVSLSGSSAANPPEMTSTTARPGSAFLPAVPLGSANGAWPAFRLLAPIPIYPPNAFPAQQPYYPPLGPPIPQVQVLGIGSPKAAGWSAPAMHGAALQQSVKMTGQPPGNQGNLGVVQDQVLSTLVKEKIEGGLLQWLDTLHVLKGQEKTDFMIASLPAVVEKCRFEPAWLGPVDAIMSGVGMTALLAQDWPDGRSLVSLLAVSMSNAWLKQALATDAGTQSLFKADSKGWSPLYHAVRARGTEAVQSILACDDDAGSLRTLLVGHNRGMALHLACAMNSARVVDLLLAHKGKEQRLHSAKDCLLPLHTAMATIASEEVVSVLLKECAEEQTRMQSSFYKRNALMLAAVNLRLPFVKALLAIEATMAEQLQARDAKGRTAIDYANSGGHPDIIHMIETAVRTLSIASSSSSSTASPRQ